MHTIKYRFADGTTSEIEVTDKFYALYVELVQQEKRNHWKETRRHTSLNYLMENGIDFESPAADPLSALLQGYDLNGNRKRKRSFATRYHATTCNSFEKIKKTFGKNLIVTPFSCL